MPLISVIIPTKDSAGTIGVCLDSLASQTCADFEVLVQDGLSADGTVDVVEAFRVRNPGLAMHVFQERDGGIYDAMNRALGRARGEYVLFLGSDDRLFDADTLLRVSQSLTAHDDVVYGDVVSPRFAGRYGGRFSIDRIKRSNICHQAIFVRRRVFDALGTFDLRFRVLADWEHNMRWFLAPEVRVRHIDMVIAHYADGGMSSCSIDPTFAREQRLLYVRHGRHCVPTGEKARIVAREIFAAIRRRDWPRLARGLASCPAVIARQRPVAR